MAGTTSTPAEATAGIALKTAAALERKGMFGNTVTTAMGNIVAADTTLDPYVREVTHGKGLNQIVWEALQTPANERLLGIVAKQTETGGANLPKDIERGTAKLPKETVTAFAGFAKKATAAYEDKNGHVQEVLTEAAQAKAKHAALAVSPVPTSGPVQNIEGSFVQSADFNAPAKDKPGAKLPGHP